MKLASFDIFDTTLVRKCGSPDNIFYLLSKRIYPRNQALQNSFFQWRKEAEQKAMIRLKNNYLRLEDIYTEFDTVSFPEWDVEQLIAMETEIELTELIAVSEIKQLISQKRNEGYTICFISDMYLPEQVLKSKLLEEGCADIGDKVFVSCECRATKSEGALYEIVRKNFDPIALWEHYGDNVYSDYKKALKRGIKATLIHNDYTPVEQFILSSSTFFPFYSDLSVLIGLQRATRLSLQKKSDNIDNASDFIASLYYPYVDFLFKKARNLGITKLHFLSRDGYVLYKIAEVVQLRYPEIKLNYLFVSRYSLFLPSIYSLSREEMYENKGISSFYRHKVKVKDILDGLHITLEELGDTFTNRITFKQILTSEQENLFFEVLQSAEIRKKILKKAEKERKILVDYFAQEGLFDMEKQALVDVGWIGTSRLMINRILTNEGGQLVEGFYWGCAPESLAPRYGVFHSFYASSLYHSDIVTLLEQYYSASLFASTKGYYYDKEKIRPEFKDVKFTQSQEVVEDNINALQQFTQLISSYDYMDFSQAMSVWGGLYLKAFGEISCKIPFSTFDKLGIYEDGSSHCRVLAKINVFQLLSYLYKGKIRGVYFPRQSIYYTYGVKIFKPEYCWRERRRAFVKKYISLLSLKIYYYLRSYI
ncbi:hypothetical protein [Phocaeicola plebeius]|uniref:hypothetical protein n=1 Tax=Phocaeicola plebeius TaxID=310297 RepID=UPI0021ACCD3C|nr:hypothetical protein [Phocaeicola plebeius]MCR8883421.1 hypothetical protein [Phocaeicola plebeius]